jgi:hypothetical protein
VPTMPILSQSPEGRDSIVVEVYNRSFHASARSLCASQTAFASAIEYDNVYSRNEIVIDPIAATQAAELPRATVLVG